MDWTNKNIHPSKVVDLGDEVEVMVLEIDEGRRRISLGIKQCQENPWDAFGTRFQKGDKIAGKIKSITDFGIFLGLDGGIDGLVHLSDISWTETGEDAVRNYKKGDDLETVILAVDPERERISLGVKQLEEDNFSGYTSANDKGSVVKGSVKEVDAKGAVITLADEVEGYLKVSELSRDKVEDAATVLSVGAEVEVVITNVDRKNRSIALSIKAKDAAEEKAAIKQHSTKAAEAAAPATLGDLIKAQMEGQDKQ
jgi:small subunit ribosomal protein S1